jgi:hypothetical protein
MPRDDSLSLEQHEKERKTRHALYDAHKPGLGCIAPVLGVQKSWDEAPAGAEEKLYSSLLALQKDHPFVHRTQVKQFDAAISACLAKLNPESFNALGPRQKCAVLMPHLRSLHDALEASRMQHLTMATYHGMQAKQRRAAGSPAGGKKG